MKKTEDPSIIAAGRIHRADPAAERSNPTVAHLESFFALTLLTPDVTPPPELEQRIEELTGHKILSPDGIITPNRGNEGVDLYVTTSSAGGGLQMMVSGVIKIMTAESAERAALGGGAIVMDVIAIDDGRSVHEKIIRIRNLRIQTQKTINNTQTNFFFHTRFQFETILI